MTSKIFGIGFHRTGTSSLAAALNYLGFSVTGPNGVNNPNIKYEAEEMAFKLVETYDAFQDNPWPLLYKQLDHRYPGSKFILTLRSTASWINSVVNYFGTNTTPMREWIYGIGYPKGNEQIYINRYERHNREVLNYFNCRPDDFLVLDITAGEGWEKLCPFLGKTIPVVPFPHLNQIGTSLEQELA